MVGRTGFRDGYGQFPRTSEDSVVSWTLRAPVSWAGGRGRDRQRKWVVAERAVRLAASAWARHTTLCEFEFCGWPHSPSWPGSSRAGSLRAAVASSALARLCTCSEFTICGWPQAPARLEGEGAAAGVGSDGKRMGWRAGRFPPIRPFAAALPPPGDSRLVALAGSDAIREGDQAGGDLHQPLALKPRAEA